MLLDVLAGRPCEIDELLHIMPTPRQLADVLAVTRDCVQAIPH